MRKTIAIEAEKFSDPAYNFVRTALMMRVRPMDVVETTDGLLAGAKIWCGKTY